MLLSSLIGADAAAPAGSGNVEVAGITSDSRNVRPGFVFAAISGSKADGARFISDAVTKGAVAILTRQDTEVVGIGDVPVLRADEPRRVLALMAARFYGLQQPQTVVAVTGTSGKTSVADFTRQIYASLGHKSASLGTIGLVKGDSAVYGSLTTPDPVSLHKTLAELAAEGVTHLAFEASSHGLDQHRLDGVLIKAAGLHQSRPRSSRLSPDDRRVLSPPSCACSRNCCPRTAPPSSMPTARKAHARRRRRKAAGAASSPSGAPAKA